MNLEKQKVDWWLLEAGVWAREMGNHCQKVGIFSNEITSPGNVTYSMVTIINNTALYI